MNKGTANWWLYTSPAGGGGDTVETGSLTNLEVEDGGRISGPVGPGPGSKKYKDVSSPNHSETLVRSERREVTAEVAISSVPPKSYKEALLTPAKEIVEPRERKKKKTRQKMVNRGFPRAMDDRNRRDDRREERNWDARRSSGIGGGGSRGANLVRLSCPPRQSNQQWQRKSTQTSSSSASMVNTNNSSQLIPTPEKSVICYKCDEEGHNSKECTLKVCCLVCEKDSHITRRYVWPNQPKPVMPAVGLADPDLGFFSAQQVKMEKKMVKDSTLGLIQVVKGHLTATSLYGGLIQQF
jgi:hypothetical protein